MTETLAKCRFRRVTPKDKLADDPDPSQLLETARLAARTAHEIASPPLVSALGYLASLSDNSLLPVELRYEAKQAALRVAEAAVHLEYLPEVFNAYRTVTRGFPTNAAVIQLPCASVGDQLSNTSEKRGVRVPLAVDTSGNLYPTAPLFINSRRRATNVPGVAPGQFSWIRAIALAPKGGFTPSDTGNKRIQQHAP